MTLPKITIIGSTKFRAEIKAWAWEKTKQGFLVFFSPFAKEEIDELETYRELLEELHCQKILMADMVFVFNKNNYIGASMRDEIKFASMNNKILKYLE